MYLQTIFGPRFLFPIKTNSNSHKYYYKKEEILQINKEYEFVIIKFFCFYFLIHLLNRLNKYIKNNLKFFIK